MRPITLIAGVAIVALLAAVPLLGNAFVTAHATRILIYAIFAMSPDGFVAFDRERHKQSWWDLWAKAPSAVEMVEVQRQAWDALVSEGLNPFTPLVELYRLGVGFGRDEFGDTFTRLSLLKETPT